jgi:putative spermidine/putrescine transport system substrate-binding protein
MMQSLRRSALLGFALILVVACVPEETPAADGDVAADPDEADQANQADQADTDDNPEDADADEPQELGGVTFVDTAGGANFQRFFNEILPGASEELGLDIDYVPSSAPEMQQRLSAQAEGQGDIGLMLVKPDGIGNMLEEGIELVDLTEHTDAIPNLDDVDPAELQTALGVPTDGGAAPFWRDQFGLIYNEEHIPDPPASWQEFFERRGEWEGRIGMIRPDADSGGGRIMLRDFLIAEGADFDLEFAELQETSEWQQGLENFAEFSQAFHEPLASEPALLFQQFASGEIWITEYAIDFSLWTRDQGLLPESIRASFLEEGHYGDAAYLAIPANATEEQRTAALELVNWLLSVDTQVNMITEMWQYMGIERFEEVPEEVWENIPHWDEVQESRIPLENADAFGWLRENGMEYSAG